MTPSLLGRRHLLQLSAAMLAACGSPVHVLRQSPSESPGSLPGFVVSALDFKAFIMKGEPVETWLATRTDEQKASFEKDKERLDETFRASLRKHASGFQLAWDDEQGAAPPAGAGRLTGRVLGEMHGVFLLSNPAGDVIDEVEVKYEVGWGDITSHMQMFGSLAGEHLGQHLNDRKG